MPRFFLLFLLLMFLGGAFSGQALAEPARPNIVFIVSDDQAWTDYGFMGHPEIKTPHLDKLAAQSLVFKRGYTTTSLCCPSLAALLTGKYPHQTKVTGNDPPLPAGEKPKENPTYLAEVEELNGFITSHACLPAELGKLGYRSFQSGKWWAGNYKSGGFTHGMSHGERSRGGRHGDEGLKIGRETMQPIFDFIDGAGKDPFFVWYAPMMPHDPHTPPERLLAKYRDKTPSLHVAKYWAMCEWFDETCGQLLGFLDDRKLAENTIVVYVTDNGWIQKTDGPRFAPKSKLSPYDGGLRSPIMIRWPNKIAPREDDTPVSIIDIAPTIYQALDHKVAALPGLNLLDEAARTKRTTIFGACFLHNAIDIHAPAKNLTWRWCISGRYKLILPGSASKDAPLGGPQNVELYDLLADPREEKNLAISQQEDVAKLRQEIDSWWKAE